VAEALELDGKAVRGAMYQASKQEAGIERLDDGTYSLIPGWRPSRKPAEAEYAPPPAANPERKPRAAGAKKPAKANKAVKRATKRTSKASPAAAPAGARAATVTVARTCLTTLVAAVLDGDAPITGRLRSALREASSATSQE
jgi:hypothetical protein